MPQPPVEDIVQFYLQAKREAQVNLYGTLLNDVSSIFNTNILSQTVPTRGRTIAFVHCAELWIILYEYSLSMVSSVHCTDPPRFFFTRGVTVLMVNMLNRYEGFCMSFLTQLNMASYPVMHGLIKKHLIKQG